VKIFPAGVFPRENAEDSPRRKKSAAEFGGGFSFNAISFED